MQILDKMFGPHVGNLQQALDRTSQRQGLLMTNLANVNVPGYKRKDMDFNIALDDAMNSGANPVRQFANDRAQRAGESTSIRVDGSNVDLEKEVMSVAETELRYNALTEMTGRYFSGLRNVIREGR